MNQDNRPPGGTGSTGPLKILIASSIDPAAIATLELHHSVVCAFGAPEDELVRHIRGCDVLVFRSGVRITGRVLRAAQKLGLVIRAGSGLDNLDVSTLRELGIPLIRVPEPGALAVAELSFALMLMLARQLRTADRLLREGYWAKGELAGFLLHGKRLGVVGCGNIGTRVGRMGRAWGMQVAGCIADATARDHQRLRDAGIEETSLEAVLQTSDFVSVHVPLMDSTRHLLDARALALMKPGAFLVNLARGGVVDEAALLRELTTEGRIAGAALDVHAAEGHGRISPLAGLDNVVLTPHIGASTVDTQRQIGERVLKLVREFSAPGEGPVAAGQPDPASSPLDPTSENTPR